MKKVLLLSLLSILIISSCKKKDHNVSTVVTASFPTIVLGNGQILLNHCWCAEADNCGECVLIPFTNSRAVF